MGTFSFVFIHRLLLSFISCFFYKCLLKYFSKEESSNEDPDVS